MAVSSILYHRSLEFSSMLNEVRCRVIVAPWALFFTMRFFGERGNVTAVYFQN